MKTCSNCGLQKSLSAFSIKRPGKLREICRDCQSVGDADRYKTSEKRRISLRNNRLRNTYGITIEDYNAMVVSQCGLCAICNELPEGKTERTSRLVVDHDHITGKVRSLLCFNCNTALGKLRENPSLLRRAANYVEEAR